MTPTRRRQIIDNRINSGLCSTCGKNKPTIGSTCDLCKQKKIDYYHKRVVLGICPCGQPLPNGKKRCIDCLNKEQIKYYRLVNDVIAHYGGVCLCCGDTKPSHLTIDGGGNKHVRQINGYKGGSALYRWLKRNNYPKGYQVLCASCNHGKARNGGVCPHIRVLDVKLSQNKKNMATMLCRRKAAIEALEAYGNKCNMCGEMQPLFLNFDHINGDGAEHRKLIKKALIVVWLRQNNYPEGFQILCDNCNLEKERPFLVK